MSRLTFDWCVDLRLCAHPTINHALSGVFTFGDNTYGQLGREADEGFDPRPSLVDSLVLAVGGGIARKGVEKKEEEQLTKVVDVGCGDDHSLVALADGSVFVWGVR